MKGTNERFKFVFWNSASLDDPINYLVDYLEEFSPLARSEKQ